MNFALKICVLSLGILLSTSVFAKVNVEYRISKMQGLLDFAMTIADEPHHAPGIKEVFLRSPYNTPEVQKSIDALKSIRESYTKSYGGNGKAKHRNSGQTVDRLFVIQSVYAKDLKEFSNRTLGLLPTSDHLVFFRELKKLEPIYEKLIWKKLSPSLKNHKLKLEAISKKANLEEMFAKSVKFYNASWPQDLPFVISLYPIPHIKNFKNSSSSTSLRSIEVHGVVVDGKPEKDIHIAGSFGVIFHEICHSIYDAQSEEVKIQLEKAFMENKSPFAAQTYAWLNESLATAIGNGWGYARGNNGKMDESEWYNNPTIDKYSKAILPVVEPALKNGRPIDQEMADQFIKIYESTFPQAIYSFDSLLSRLYVAFDQNLLNSQDLQTLIRKSFEVQILNVSAPIDHQYTITDVSENVQDSAMFIFSDKSKSQLEKVSDQVPFMKDNLKEIQKMKARSVFASLDPKGRAFIFVRADDNKQVGEAITALAKKQFIDPKERSWTY